MDVYSTPAGSGQKTSYRYRVGWRRTGFNRVPHQPILLAGESFPDEARGTENGWAYKDSHYRGPYFHNAGPEVDAKYAKYIGAFAGAVNAFRKKHKVFPVLVGTERLDADACQKIAAKIGGAPVFTSDQLDIYTIVSLLRCADLMVSSRYHGIVTCMPALVPSAGVTMDERIRNNMIER